MACRGIRGATIAEANTKEAILDGTRELLEQMIAANDVQAEDLACAIFTTTRDLNADFPAVAARRMGWDEVALLCGHEMEVPDAMTGVIRVMLLVNTEKGPNGMVHVYLKGAQSLRSRGLDDGAGANKA